MNGVDMQEKTPLLYTGNTGEYVCTITGESVNSTAKFVVTISITSCIAIGTEFELNYILLIGITPIGDAYQLIAVKQDLTPLQSAKEEMDIQESMYTHTCTCIPLYLILSWSH